MATYKHVSTIFSLLFTTLFAMTGNAAGEHKEWLSEDAIAALRGDPASIDYHSLPEEGCVSYEAIKYCAGVRILKGQEYIPKQTQPAPKTQTPYLVEEVRFWKSLDGAFVLLAMETRGTSDFVVDEQAEIYRRSFSRSLSPDDYENLSSQGWTASEYFADTDVVTNIPSNSLFSEMSSALGSSLETTEGRGNLMIFGYPSHGSEVVDRISRIMKRE